MAKEDAQVQYFESRLSRNPQSLVFSRLADSYRKNGDIQQAIEVCIQGLKSHPDYLTGRVILGRCYLEQEKLKEALAEFAKVVELDRRNQVAVKMIADICVRQEMKEKADDLYAYLLRMDPDNQTLVKLAGMFCGTGDVDIMRIVGTTVAAQARSEVGVAEDTAPQAGAKDAGMVTGPMEEITIGEKDYTTTPQAAQGVISGDDVAETIFDEEEQAVQPVDGVPAEIDIGEGAIVIGHGEALVSESESLVAPKTGWPAPEESASTQDKELPAIKDAVGPEADEDVASDMSGDDVAERMDGLFSESLIKDGAPPTQSELVEEELAVDSDGDQTHAYSIPDHVLTPTLADIYFQQGQPQLALQIYRRLLDLDPDNERIAKRILEIEVSIGSREIGKTVAQGKSRKKDGTPVVPADNRKKKQSAPRPLSGVRIKKMFKDRLGESK